ncbi:MAG: hypothetical protein EBU72_12530 [Betaproteobacteria bacterium]|nr:hypothetical protein [Betaproteobacteria bacterium]
MAKAGKLKAVQFNDASTPTLTVSVADLTQNAALLGKLTGAQLALESDASTVSANLATVQTWAPKLSRITLENGATLSMTATQFGKSAALIGKVNKPGWVNVTGVTGSSLASVLSAAAVKSFDVDDSAGNIASRLDALQAAGDRLGRIRVTSGAAAWTLTDARWQANQTALAKVSGGYSVALTEVAASAVADRLTAQADGVSLTTVSVKDTAAQVGQALDSLQAAGDRLKTITLKDSGGTVTDTAAGLSLHSGVMAKISGKYALRVADSSAQLKAHWSALLAKASSLSQVQVTDANRPTWEFTPGEYRSAAAVLGKLKGAAISLNLTGNADSYTLKPKTDGSFDLKSLTKSTTENGNYKAVQFFKFKDFTAFGDTGHSDVNALLLGGSPLWWSDQPAQTSNVELRPGLYALSSSSSRHDIRYGFMKSLPATATAQDANGFTAMGSKQQQAVRDAFSYLSTLINVTFSEDNSADSGQADINFGMNLQPSSAGYANPPHGGGDHNVFLMLDASATSNKSFEPGEYGWETVLHEIGHTLGLKHPGNYNAAGGGTPAPYLSKALDTTRYSLMSYNKPSDSRGVDYTVQRNADSTSYSTVVSTYSVSTYMPLDILALQYLYGVAPARNDQAEASTLTWDKDWRGFKTLYTPAGATLDLGQLDRANVVDLRPGSFSSIGVLGVDPASYLSTVPGTLQSLVRQNQTYYGYNNVALSWGSTIQAVVGGSGSDVVYVDPRSMKDAQIDVDGGAGQDAVYLPGTAADWEWAPQADQGMKATNLNTQVTVMMRRFEKLGYYDVASAPLQHTAVDLKW